MAGGHDDAQRDRPPHCLVVTRETGSARRAAGRVVFPDQGRILETAIPDEFFDHSHTERTRDLRSEILIH